MKKIEMVNKAIYEKIMSKPLVNWYRVSEIDNEVYEIKFYVNFIVDENGMKVFEEDIKELVKAIEDNTLMKIDNKFYIFMIDKVNIVEDGVLEITTICEKIQKIQKIN